MDDRLRVPPISPAKNSKAGKKESTGPRLSQPCPPCATPSSNSSLDHRRSDVPTAENGFATRYSVNKSAKVVLGRELINARGRTAYESPLCSESRQVIASHRNVVMCLPGADS